MGATVIDGNALAEELSEHVHQELEQLKTRLAERLPEFDSAIIDAHHMMLEDRGGAGLRELDKAARGMLARAVIKAASNAFWNRTAMSKPFCRRSPANRHFPVSPA